MTKLDHFKELRY